MSGSSGLCRRSGLPSAGQNFWLMSYSVPHCVQILVVDTSERYCAARLPGEQRSAIHLSGEGIQGVGVSGLARLHGFALADAEEQVETRPARGIGQLQPARFDRGVAIG